MASKSASVVDDRADLDPGAACDLARPDRSDLEVLALVDEAGRLVEPRAQRCGRSATSSSTWCPPRSRHSAIAASRSDAADAAPAEALADEQVADPALEGRVIQAPPEPMDDEAGRSAVGEGQERRRVDVADERLVRGAKRLGVGIGVERVQLARERERIGEVVAAERAQVDARPGAGRRGRRPGGPGLPRCTIGP